MNDLTSGNVPIELCAFIFRGRPLHNAHLEIIQHGLSRAKRLIAIIGSSFAARSERNPFTQDEVIEMIRGSLPKEDFDRIVFAPVQDTLYNIAEWQASVQKAVNAALGGIADNRSTVALIGHHKDAGTGFYLKLFPQWSSIAVENLHENLSATDIRNSFFSEQPDWGWISTCVPNGTFEFLQKFATSGEYVELKQEIAYYSAYRQAHADAADLIASRLKYRTEIKHQTVDACVVQSGNVLLIQRKNFPGRNLWALPGGFLDNDETMDEAVLRELREETRLKVPSPVLMGNLVTSRTFDAPHRSSRGRVITRAYLFHLPPAFELPQVKARSDAKLAKWVPIADIRPELMFEDHAQIIHNLLNDL